MNKRAQTRLLGVTAIILLAVAAIFFSLQSRGGTAYFKTVKEISTDSKLVGERVKVGGAVVTGSWDRKSNPMRFTIRDEADKASTGPIVKVVYSGAVPSTFGDGVTAIVTGKLAADGTINANEMITKCPSKYESATGVIPIGDLLGTKGESMVGKPTKATGFVKAGTIAAPGGDARFVVASTKGGAEVVKVVFEGALPSGMAGDSQVVLTGAIEADGKFVATEVALTKK